MAGIKLHELDANDLFDVIDYQLERYLMRNAELEQGLDKLRAAQSNMYDETYHPIDQLYGSNDEAPPPRGAKPGEVSDPLGRPRVVRPYIPPTESDDGGFTGMMEPLG